MCIDGGILVLFDEHKGICTVIGNVTTQRFVLRKKSLRWRGNDYRIKEVGLNYDPFFLVRVFLFNKTRETLEVHSLTSVGNRTLVSVGSQDPEIKHPKETSSLGFLRSIPLHLYLDTLSSEWYLELLSVVLFVDRLPEVFKIG